MPLGQTAITLTVLGKFSPCACRCDSRKPWLRPSVVPGRKAAKIFL
jgi:hypothetical protein